MHHLSDLLFHRARAGFFFWACSLCCFGAPVDASAIRRPVYPIQFENRTPNDVDLSIFYWADATGAVSDEPRTWCLPPGKGRLVSTENNLFYASSFYYVARDKATGAWLKRGSMKGTMADDVVAGVFKITVNADDDAGHRVRIHNLSDRAIKFIVREYHDFKYEPQKGGTWNIPAEKSMRLSLHGKAFHAIDVNYEIRDAASGALIRAETKADVTNRIALDRSETPSQLARGRNATGDSRNTSDERLGEVSVTNASDRSIRIVISKCWANGSEHKVDGFWEFKAHEAAKLTEAGNPLKASAVTYQIKDALSGVVLKEGRASAVNRKDGPARVAISLSTREIEARPVTAKPSQPRRNNSRYVARRPRPSAKTPAGRSQSEGTITGSTGGDVALGVGALYLGWLANRHAEKTEAVNSNRESIARNGYQPGSFVKSSRGGYWSGGWEGAVIEKINDRVYEVKIFRAPPDSTYRVDQRYKFLDSEMQPY